jgi:hypothetical protein
MNIAQAARILAAVHTTPTGIRKGCPEGYQLHMAGVEYHEYTEAWKAIRKIAEAGTDNGFFRSLRSYARR